MKQTKLLALLLMVVGYTTATAQTLSLDSCRAMALRNNKQLSVARAQVQVAKNVRKAAKTKYLPHVDLVGGYMHTSEEVSLLNDDIKDMLSGVGTKAAGAMAPYFEKAGHLIHTLAEKGLISPQQLMRFNRIAAAAQIGIPYVGNSIGDGIKDAFRTDTRDIFAASVMLKQPIYMGGAITAGNKMAEIGEHAAETKIEVAEHEVLYNIDQAYWMVVSLHQKQRLADQFLSLVTKLDGDVQKMIREGVATRADGLKVSVRVNEADMVKTQVESGLSLARMLLCQLCGMPLDSSITLADENKDDIAGMEVNMKYDMQESIENRPEVRLLNDGIEVSKQATKMARAGYLPQVVLTGGYLVTNPSVLNGFENRFRGMWNVGVLLRMPVLDWGEARYKVRSEKVKTNIATLNLSEAKEKMELQITQSDYKLRVANKKLVAAMRNIQKADENLRCANLGFKEGVMSTTDVMAAQTAWFQAQSEKIDAQADVRLSESGLKKALGQM